MISPHTYFSLNYCVENGRFLNKAVQSSNPCRWLVKALCLISILYWFEDFSNNFGRFIKIKIIRNERYVHIICYDLGNIPKYINL